MESELEIFGVPISPLDRAAALEECARILEGNTAARVFTPNPQMLLACRKDQKLKSLISSAELRVADGIGISLAARIMGRRSFPRIAGIELAEDVLRVARDMGLGVYLLGGKEGVAKRAAEKLTLSLPGLKIVGTHHGYFQKEGEENRKLTEEIRAAAPQIIFVCLGFPTQELWIEQNIETLPSLRLAIGLGGSLDVWSGDKKRAPLPLRKLGLEWLWRTALQPKRARIFKDIPLFICLVVKESFQGCGLGNFLKRKLSKPSKNLKQ